jgi:hypothetical protein
MTNNTPALARLRSKEVDDWFKEKYPSCSMHQYIEAVPQSVSDQLDLNNLILTYRIEGIEHTLRIESKHLPSGDPVSFELYGEEADKSLNFWIGNYLEQALPLDTYNLHTEVDLNVSLLKESRVTFELVFKQENFKSALRIEFLKRLKKFTSAFKESRTAVTKSDTTIYGKYKYALDCENPGNTTSVCTYAEGTLEELIGALK